MSDQIADAHLDSESRSDRMIIRIGGCDTYRPDPWGSDSEGIMDRSGGPGSPLIPIVGLIVDNLD